MMRILLVTLTLIPTLVFAGPLREKLDEYRAGFSAKAPEELKKTFDDGVIAVAESGVLETAKKKGEKAPDFTINGIDGKGFTLTTALNNGPVVLLWYRGGWCPYCNIQLQMMQAHYEAFQKLNAEIVALSPEKMEKSLATSKSNALSFVVASDLGNNVARKYGINYRLPEGVIEAFKGRIDVPAYNGDETYELPLSATYVIAKDGTICQAFIDADYRARPEPADLLKAVEACQS